MQSHPIRTKTSAGNDEALGVGRSLHAVELLRQMFRHYADAFIFGRITLRRPYRLATACAAQLQALWICGQSVTAIPAFALCAILGMARGKRTAILSACTEAGCYPQALQRSIRSVYKKHSEAFSFQIATDAQAETDRLWNAIVGNDSQESACGWCKDKWGLSWQITPR